MGNRYLNQFQYTLEKDSVTLFSSLVIGAAGAVSTVKGGGIKAITKTGTGKYEIEFEDKWSRYLDGHAGIVSAAAPNIAMVYVKGNPATLQADIASTKKLTIECLDFAGAAANPASGTVLSLVSVFRKSSVGPFDN
jgi:hypothetical protein